MQLLTRGRLIAAVGIMGLGVVLVAHGRNSGRPARVGVPYDWSHRQVVFSKPSSQLQANLLQKDPRYLQQMLRRNAGGRMGAGAAGPEFFPRGGFPRRHPAPVHPPQSLAKDWAETIGPGATTGTATYPQFPAKYSYTIDVGDESCSDYVVFSTNQPGVNGTSDAAPGQPSIMAYANLYTDADGDGACSPPNAPMVDWAYNTNAVGDTTGVVSGSPAISGDGTKIAFVESKAGGSVLDLLFYAVNDGVDTSTGAYVTAAPSTVLASGSGWTACPTNGASCMISLPFGTTTAVNSSPFYNFAFDTLYLGDDAGVLHKFTGVFNGTPAEVTTGGWPITVDAGASLTPPVFDSVSNNVFVGDSDGVLSYVMDTGSTTGTCASGAPPCLGATTILATSGSGFPIIDPPTLDPTTGKVFVFAGDTGALSCVTTRDACVVQVNTDLSGAVRLSMGPPGAPLHAGAFDNTYLNSSPGETAGYLWVCGKGATDTPALRRIGFDTNGTMVSGGIHTLALGSKTGAAGQCSPVTEIFNPTVGTSGTDFIFFSVQSGDLPTVGSTATLCVGTGCVMGAIVVPGTAFPGSLSNSAPEFGGTSGIIIDNVGNLGDDSSLYFSRLGQSTLTNCGGSGTTMVGCAVKLTQSGFN